MGWASLLVTTGSSYGCPWCPDSGGASLGEGELCALRAVREKVAISQGQLGRAQLCRSSQHRCSVLISNLLEFQRYGKGVPLPDGWRGVTQARGQWRGLCPFLWKGLFNEGQASRLWFEGQASCLWFGQVGPPRRPNPYLLQHLVCPAPVTLPKFPISIILTL